MYDGSDTLDISSYFAIDENAGTPTYTLSDASTGTGTLEGRQLTMTTLGTFVVKVSTEINGVYNTGEHTLTITVQKAMPNVTKLPTVKDRTYHPAATLTDSDLQGGTVKNVKGEPLAGTWSWKKAGVVATGDNDGYVAVFTPEDTVHYAMIEKTIPVKVEKVVPYIVKAPVAGTISYGASLRGAILSGGVVHYSENDNTVVAGTWTWKEADTKPMVADSDATQYDVVFMPTEANNYSMVARKITLIVKKADVAPNKPESTMTTVYTNDTLEKVTLPKGWTWKTEDRTKALEVGKAITATAIYTGADKGNYVTESAEVSITRQACIHTWDGGVVTKAPTATVKGERTYTCTVCKAIRTEEVASLGAPAVGTKITSDDGTATYKITISNLKKGTVTYIAPRKKKATKIIIPDTVVIDGVTYQVTAIEKNAFQKNAYAKKVIIGSNVATIGANAFDGCKRLESVTIGNRVKTIGKCAFANCKKLKTVKFGKNVVTIRDKAFYKCTALTKVTIPAKTKTIGKQAFYGCKNLRTVVIGKNVSKIGTKAFYGCKKGKKLIVKSKKLTAKEIDILKGNQ